MQQRHGHQLLRHVARALRHVGRVARVARHVLDHERLPRRQHPARDPRARREATSDQLSSPSPATASKTSSSVSSSCRKIGRGLARRRCRARPRRSTAGTSRALLGAEDAGRDRGSQLITHPGLPALVAISDSTLLSWNGVSSGCFARTSAQMPLRCGVAKLLPVQRSVPPPEPGHVDVDAAREELDRRRGVRVEGERVRALVAAHGDHGREAPGVTLDRACCARTPRARCGWKYAVSASSWSTSTKRFFVVDRLMLTTSKPLLDRVPQPGEDQLAAPVYAVAEHAHAVDLAVGRQLRTMPAQAVPWPQTSPSSSSDDDRLRRPRSRPRRSWRRGRPAGGRARRRCRGCRRGRPRRSSPSSAHSRVTRSGQAARRPAPRRVVGQAPGRQRRRSSRHRPRPRRRLRQRMRWLLAACARRRRPSRG